MRVVSRAVYTNITIAYYPTVTGRGQVRMYRFHLGVVSILNFCGLNEREGQGRDVHNY